MIALPSITTLHRRLEKYDFLPGIPQIPPLLLPSLPGENQGRYGHIYGFDTLKNDKNVSATHGLAALFTGTVIRHKQIVDYHLTRSKVSGEVYHELVLSLISSLYNESEIWIDAIVTDLGPENTSMLSKFGVSMSINNISCSIEHPLDPTKQLWIIPDPVHCFKNICCNFRTKKEALLPYYFVQKYNLHSDKARMDNITKLHRMQEKMIYKPARKLTNEVIKPSQYKK